MLDNVFMLFFHPEESSFLIRREVWRLRPVKALGGVGAGMPRPACSGVPISGMPASSEPSTSVGVPDILIKLNCFDHFLNSSGAPGE